MCLKGQQSTESLQNRAAGFGQAGKGEAGRGEGEHSFVMVFWRTRARPALWKGLSALPPSLGKHGVGARHYSGESEAEGLMRLFHGPSEIHVHVNKPWRKRRR